MPYNKDKQQAFQAAQQGATEAFDSYESIVKDSADYGAQLKHLTEEVNEAYQQINNALENASEIQRQRLEQYQQDLQKIVNEVNQSDI
jgi:short-subunit dehydrogenase involved in D-alanine esterification of teichoic acids